VVTRRVFVSYRRDDSKHAAGRLAERLDERFTLFMDVARIRPGSDFTTAIREAVDQADVLLAVIGSQWLTITVEDGGRRIDQPDDWVALEIGTALRRGTPVIPVLVDGAEMPRRNELPAALADMANRQPMRIAHETFATDSAQLIKTIEGIVRNKRSTAPTTQPKKGGLARRKQIWIAAGTACLLVAGTAAVATSTAVRARTSTGPTAATTAPANGSPTPAAGTEGSPTSTTPAEETPTTAKSKARSTGAPKKAPPVEARATNAPQTTAHAKPPAITTKSLPDGTVGRTYSAVLKGEGQRPLTWRKISGALPSNTELTSSGHIRGGPLSGTGTTVFTVKLVDGTGMGRAKSFTITVTRLRSDINGDGQVDCADQRTLKSNFNKAGTFTDGDVNGDGTVNIFDLSMMLSDWTGSSDEC
jgi:hypothetical protein